LELHIEQGVVLENGGFAVGIVTAIVGITRIAVTFTGEAAHAGTTPMESRQDALLAASEFVLALRQKAAHSARAGRGYFVATAGKVIITPNAANVIPGEVALLLDLRSDARPLMDEFLGELHPVAVAAARQHSVVLTRFECVSDTAPAHCDPALMAGLRESATMLGHSYMDITSGAGHDCAFLSRVAPSAMLFVPSRGGKSHCPEEWTDPAQVIKGVATLYEAVWRWDASATAASAETMG
jgi:N-carbamoyl-L-amino-acid hydrolase